MIFTDSKCYSVTSSFVNIGMLNFVMKCWSELELRIDFWANMYMHFINSWSVGEIFGAFLEISVRFKNFGCIRQSLMVLYQKAPSFTFFATKCNPGTLFFLFQNIELEIWLMSLHACIRVNTANLPLIVGWSFWWYLEEEERGGGSTWKPVVPAEGNLFIVIIYWKFFSAGDN